MKDILVIMTGGTIDAEAYPDPANPPPNAVPLKDSAVPDALHAMGYDDDCRCYQWLMKDSKEFTERNLDELATMIRERRAQHIIITHGTDRMPENSRDLMKFLGSTDKTVIMTGAMIPLANGKESDGYENLRFAVENIEKWPPGVHVVMHGRRFDPARVRKNFSSLRFEEVR